MKTPWSRHKQGTQTLLGAIRAEILRDAADKLDRQAEAHGEEIRDYTALLRAWADNPERWWEGR